MSRLFKFVSCLMLITACSNANAYPLMREAEYRFEVRLPDDQPYFVSVPLYDETGSPRYWLLCHGGTDSQLDALSAETGINFVGPFACRLDVKNERNSEFSLLAEESEAYWFTRGQFHSGELTGDCASYPEYGLVRTFRLRGFRLQLALQDVNFVNGVVDKFTFIVEVQRDKEALSDNAQALSIPEPVGEGGNCRPPK